MRANTRYGVYVYGGRRGEVRKGRVVSDNGIDGVRIESVVGALDGSEVRSNERHGVSATTGAEGSIAASTVPGNAAGASWPTPRASTSWRVR